MQECLLQEALEFLYHNEEPNNPTLPESSEKLETPS